MATTALPYHLDAALLGAAEIRHPRLARRVAELEAERDALGASPADRERWYEIMDEIDSLLDRMGR